MKSWPAWLNILLGIFIGLLCSAILMIVVTQPRGEPITLKPLPTSRPIMVYVNGAVHQPGVYPLQTGSRIQDAIQAAGGTTDQANLNALNLAAILKDGDRVTVLSGTEAAQPVARKTATAIPGLININTATQEELMSLKGIGAGRAQDIIQYRQEHGPFKTIEALQDVPGIGDHIFNELKSQITVEPTN